VGGSVRRFRCEGFCWLAERSGVAGGEGFVVELRSERRRLWMMLRRLTAGVGAKVFARLLGYPTLLADPDLM
jgi:hypothetical protein